MGAPKDLTVCSNNSVKISVPWQSPSAALRQQLSTSSSLYNHLHHSTTNNSNSSSSPATNGLVIRGLGYLTKKKEEILRDINMTVPKGTIYGLLGPSGCGKTTLLRCVVGCLRPQYGQIMIFGKQPGRETAQIPGTGVGYMPQENTLYENMTIEEVLIYYGRVFFLSIEELYERIKGLMGVLELPDKGRMIKKLSGGQKRRVSFAIALIHRPGLLILDEPTSGVDPLLREKLWQHLMCISKNQGATIIITTHYIEEARRSHNVGFMRQGRLLMQEDPDRLLADRGVETLEDAFLDICRNQGRISCVPEQEKIEYKGNVPTATFVTDPVLIKKRIREWFFIFFGALWRHLVSDIREPLTIGFQYVIPILSMLLFALCIGGQPFDIPLGIVNEEVGFEGFLGRQFVGSLDPHLFNVFNYSDLSEAAEAAKVREVWGYLHIKRGFTESLYDVLFPDSEPLNSSIQSSHINLHADLTDRVITTTMHRYLDESFISFVQQVIKDYNKEDPDVRMPQFIANLPIKMGSPIYGRLEKKSYRGYRDFMLPGLIVNITYAIAYSLTALNLINERKNQTFERNYVAGVKPSQMLLAFALSRVIMMSLYLFLIIYLPIAVFSMPVDCIHILHSLPLLMLLNISGMTYGMVVSALCDSIEQCAVFSAATLFIILFMSGTIWPMEAIPAYFRWLCEYAPTTAANEALRDIWYKDWSIFSPRVATAHGITLVWTFVFFLIGLRFFRLSK
ncbi:ABC transporter G family member 23-like [Panonychus citri]|uniref:ABC transporter G family member 23-like n=1 Tax=Panonychus citri TaxID=50023 RepID=UPI002307097A|nr:ABC transporter G family member 23-like [Panonychus citri]